MDVDNFVILTKVTAEVGNAIVDAVSAEYVDVTCTRDEGSSERTDFVTSVKGVGGEDVTDDPTEGITGERPAVIDAPVIASVHDESWHFDVKFDKSSDPPDA